MTYAYALYDLGRALRLAGNAGAAVPVLTKRLQIDNQRTTVRNELGLAKKAASSGGVEAPPASATPAPGTPSPKLAPAPRVAPAPRGAPTPKVPPTSSASPPANG